MSADRAIEAEIVAKGLTAARVTPSDIEAAIASENYFTAADGVDLGIVSGYKYPGALDMITFCVVILRNGHKIVGVNTGPVHPANFSADLARKLARQHAIDQIWPLLGYALRDRLAQEVVP